MRLIDLYKVNSAWEHGTKINVVSFNDYSDMELITALESLVKYGDKEVFCFEGDRVVIKK